MSIPIYIEIQRQSKNNAYTAFCNQNPIKRRRAPNIRFIKNGISCVSVQIYIFAGRYWAPHVIANMTIASLSIRIYRKKLIETETKWPPIRRQQFQNIDSNFTEICSQMCSLNKSTLVWIMTWRRIGDKPLFEPMSTCSLTYICVTRRQWVKYHQTFRDVLQLTKWYSQLQPYGARASAIIMLT